MQVYQLEQMIRMSRYVEHGQCNWGQAWGYPQYYEVIATKFGLRALTSFYISAEICWIVCHKAYYSQLSFIVVVTWNASEECEC